MANPFDDLAARELEQTERTRRARLEREPERAREQALAREYNDTVYGVLVQFRDALYPSTSLEQTSDPVIDDYWISEQPPRWVIYRDTLVHSHGGRERERSEQVYAVTLAFDGSGKPSHFACGFYSDSRLVESTRADLSRDALVQALRNLYKFRSYWMDARRHT